MSIPCEISIEIKKFKDSLIGLGIILEKIEKTKIIEELETEKIKEIIRKRLKKLEIKKINKFWGRPNSIKEKIKFKKKKKKDKWDREIKNRNKD